MYRVKGPVSTPINCPRLEDKSMRKYYVYRIAQCLFTWILQLAIDTKPVVSNRPANFNIEVS